MSCSCCAYAGSIREHILSENTFYKRTHSVHMQALHFSAALQKCFFFFLYFLRIYGLCTSRQRRRNIFSITVLCFIFSIFFVRIYELCNSRQRCKNVFFSCEFLHKNKQISVTPPRIEEPVYTHKKQKIRETFLQFAAALQKCFFFLV